MTILLRYLPDFLQSFATTLWVTLAAIPAAFACGFLVLALRRSGQRWCVALAMAYIEVMRNTPLVAQLLLIYFGLPLLGWFPPPFVCGVAALALQHGAFLAEILRAGIESVSDRQMKAARSLGMRRHVAMRVVVLPQAWASTLPSITNELIVLLKDTSVVSGIGVMDLTLRGKLIIERTGASFEVFVIIALFYLVLTTALSAALRVVELRRAKWS